MDIEREHVENFVVCDPNHQMIMGIIFGVLILILFIYLVLFTVKPDWLLIQSDDLNQTFNYIGTFVLSIIITVLIIIIIGIIYTIVSRYKNKMIIEMNKK